MNPGAWFAVAVVAGVFLLLAATRVAPYLVLVGALAVLLAAGVLPAGEALAGFSNEGLVTVAVLFVVAGGLRQTGVLGHLVIRVLGRPGSERSAQARLAAPVMAASAFLNNTPLVAMLLPAVQEWSRRVGIPASRLLIPLSYAAILGGTCTLIGTSTNLVVGGLWAEDGHPPMHLFTISPVGIPAALAGLAFLLLVGRRLLPDRGGPPTPLNNPREYVAEMRVTGEPVAGRTVAAAGLGDLPGVVLTALLRDGRSLPLAPATVLRAGDRLRFAGLVLPVAELQRLPGLAATAPRDREPEAPPARRVFAEAVVSRTGPLAGRTLAEARFAERYGAVVLAVSRGADRPEGAPDQIVLAPGDALFLEAGPGFVAQHQNSADFCLVGRLDGDGPATRERAGVALAILAGMVLAAGTGLLTMLQAAFVAALLMLLTGACSEETARRSIDWSMLVAIGAAFGLGAALERTGAAAALAATLLAPAGNHPWPALAVVYAVTMVLTELVTNNAAAVIVFPIAMATAQRLGVDAMPFAVAVMLAASASFSTPLGYQTNLMVFGAGGYRVADFLRIGIPMNAVLAAVTLVLTPLLFPF